MQNELSSSGSILANVLQDLTVLKNNAVENDAKSAISSIITNVGKSLALIGSVFQGVSMERRKDIKPYHVSPL